jgi:hypothetical protein
MNTTFLKIVRKRFTWSRIAGRSWDNNDTWLLLDHEAERLYEIMSFHNLKKEMESILTIGSKEFLLYKINRDDRKEKRAYRAALKRLSP